MVTCAYSASTWEAEAELWLRSLRPSEWAWLHESLTSQKQNKTWQTKFKELFSLETVSLCSPVCPGSHRDPPASDSIAPGLKACTTMSTEILIFVTHCYEKETETEISSYNLEKYMQIQFWLLIKISYPECITLSIVTNQSIGSGAGITGCSSRVQSQEPHEGWC